MHSDFENFLQDAEDHYLQPGEIAQFKQHISAMEQRLDTYEVLRNKELNIWQPVAEKFQALYPAESSQRQQKALEHWIAALRYSAMAMLLNNPTFLQRRLLEWLTDIVQAHQLNDLELQLSQLLESHLKDCLSESQWALIEPYFAQAQQILVGTELVTSA